MLSTPFHNRVSEEWTFFEPRLPFQPSFTNYSNLVEVKPIQMIGKAGPIKFSLQFSINLSNLLNFMELFWQTESISHCIDLTNICFLRIRYLQQKGHNWKILFCKFITFHLKILALLELWFLLSRMNFHVLIDQVKNLKIKKRLPTWYIHRH